MNDQIQKQLRAEEIAKWAQDCDQLLAELRWQMLAKRVRETKQAA